MGNSTVLIILVVTAIVFVGLSFKVTSIVSPSRKPHGQIFHRSLQQMSGNGVPKRICLLVPTYKRNASLFRLLEQLNEIIGAYTGPNEYIIRVTDSDKDNPDKLAIAGLCERYVTNEGKGFDDNLFSFYKNHMGGFDYILSISDDDIFSPSICPPLYLIDGALESNARAILFNIIDFVTEESGTLKVLNRHYQDVRLGFDKKYLLEYCLGLLPRHAGIVYASQLISENIENIALFRGTNHLYAVPLLIEAEREGVLFIDYPMFLFRADPPSGGAWENYGDVFHGLLLFLKRLQTILNSDNYLVAKNGFLANYLGADAWLRRDVLAKGHQLPSEQEVLRTLSEDDEVQGYNAHALSAMVAPNNAEPQAAA